MNAEAVFPYGAEAKVVVRCPVCHMPNVPTWVHDRYGYHVPYAICRGCTMGYLTEQMTREGYTRLYAGGYRALVTALTGKPRLRSVDHRTVRSYGDIITDLLGVRPIRSILDAGGSTGVIGQAVAARYGADVTILDPATQELPRERSITGWLEDSLPGQYDLALVVATSDHLTDPLAAFRNLRQAAKYLYVDFIDVALFQQLGGRLKLKIDHPLYWTAKAMHRALASTGWHVLKSRALCGESKTYLMTAVACEAT